MPKRTERETQERLAQHYGEGRWFRYKCTDGAEFKAYALTEAGAFRVLNAERPGVQANLIGFGYDL